MSKQYTNRTIQQRIEALEDFWPKLAQSRARHHAKVFMLRAVAWPRGLMQFLVRLLGPMCGHVSEDGLSKPLDGRNLASIHMCSWGLWSLVSIPSMLPCFGLADLFVTTTLLTSGLLCLPLSLVDFWTYLRHP